MLGDISSAVNIYVITGYPDMRKSIDGLCAIVLNMDKLPRSLLRGSLSKWPIPGTDTPRLFPNVFCNN